jgi:HEAT repeat protein
MPPVGKTTIRRPQSLAHWELWNSRAGTVLLKDLESVWSELTLIQYDTQIEVLGELKAKEAADLLLRILRHRYSWEGSAWKIKENTLVALGKIGDQRALPDASTYVESEADWYMKQGSLNYLIHINNGEAKAALWKAYRHDNESEVALCLVQVGELSVLPEVRARLKEWLDKFDTGGWVKTDYWGVFYCTHALLIAEDVDAIAQLRRALRLFKDGSDETRRYVSEAASGHTSKVLLDTTRGEALVPDLERFLEKHPTAVER